LTLQEAETLLDRVFDRRLAEVEAKLTATFNHEISVLASSIALTLPTSTSISTLVDNALKHRTSTPDTLAATTSQSTNPPPSPLPNITTLTCDDTDDAESLFADEEPKLVPIANTAGAGWKVVRAKQQKAKPTVKPSTPPPSAEALATELTTEQLRQMLSQREAAKKAELVAAQYLTDEEKRLDLAGLHRKWKAELQQQRQERPQMGRFDYEDLGVLTEEQKLLTKNEIRQLIRNRKYEHWIEAMKAKGIPLHQCEVCHELCTEKHRCLGTKWRSEGPRGAAKNIIITQTASGLQIRDKAIVDSDRLNKEYAEIAEEKRKLDERQKRIDEALRSQDQDQIMAPPPSTLSSALAPLPSASSSSSSSPSASPSSPSSASSSSSDNLGPTPGANVVMPRF